MRPHFAGEDASGSSSPKVHTASLRADPRVLTEVTLSIGNATVWIRSEAKRPLLNGKPTLLITDGAKFWSA
ncbi:hypothetical protein EMEDMD4_1250010 [Sinorhizobium medicae]|uniref:Uncharacterized protein n=1 Tax=Sinorhizobium medicae TaxID=110321 RepID=A0A508WR37_9HYPH|nr:hypothetical protein EMEDMD4_1250010 [Sinorhizobium medicae]